MSAFVQFLVLFLISIVTAVYSTEPLLFAEDTLEDSHGKIVFSSVIFRHGDRAPTNPYPTDRYNISNWPQGWGQLSKIGKLQEYNLGKWFRKRYDSLITNGYRYDLLKVNSSDMDRTIMSAECFLAGFFPPSAEERWADDGLKWQPVPIRAIPAEIDTVIGFKVPCEKYDMEKDLVNGSPEMGAYYLEHQKIFKYIASYSGFDISPNDVLNAIDNAWDLYDTLFIEELYNLTLPDWSKKIYPEPLKTIGAPTFSNIAYSREMRRLKAGPLIGNLLKEMRLKINRQLNETFHFYSGHDTTISVLLTALEIYNGIPPPYSTSVIIELREKDGNYFVTILYKNSTTSAPYLLELDGCGYVCTWDDFVKLTENLVPENWEAECSVNFVKSLSYRSIFELIVMSAVVFLLLVLILSIIRLHLLRRKRYSHYEIIRNNVLNVKNDVE
ncbi:prostatic acid phosphatase-like [Planococcus citri]|uniref:prostatic acid phosphatase-like n=1 Tax=Planococcus citri TaxID=170843 RepID=UPI0031F99143